eukprot:TRINITY_DN5159_c0_g1_i1.p1 TRINITY_DN5159_c0_g1~~TRINITY_DN5159_c0_g1_i1.p1  ORF type:complete len:178 (-),score=62.84 TRINITY_DN5159_c0_g1_i1:146-679(-)
MIFFFFSSRRRHTRCREVSWARRCVQETVSTQSTWGKKINNFDLSLDALGLGNESVVSLFIQDSEEEKQKKIMNTIGPAELASLQKAMAEGPESLHKILSNIEKTNPDLHKFITSEPEVFSKLLYQKSPHGEPFTTPLPPRLKPKMDAICSLGYTPLQSYKSLIIFDEDQELSLIHI